MLWRIYWAQMALTGCLKPFSTKVTVHNFVLRQLLKDARGETKSTHMAIYKDKLSVTYKVVKCKT